MLCISKNKIITEVYFRLRKGVNMENNICNGFANLLKSAYITDNRISYSSNKFENNWNLNELHCVDVCEHGIRNTIKYSWKGNSWFR